MKQRIIRHLQTELTRNAIASICTFNHLATAEMLITKIEKQKGWNKTKKAKESIRVVLQAGLTTPAIYIKAYKSADNNGI